MTGQPLARELRVREKLLTAGAQNLSDIELLAVFISSGTTKKSCVQLAQELVNHLGDLRTVLNCELQTFQQIAGLGVVRYVQLQAAREMCRRSDFISLQKAPPLTNTKDTFSFLKRQLRDKKNETFVAIFLDSKHHIIAYEELFSGTINNAAIYPRPLVERVLKLNAAAIIIAHNHPSGNTEPSLQDKAITQRLQKALELVDTRLLDHLIIGDNEIYSIMSEMKWRCH